MIRRCGTFIALGVLAPAGRPRRGRPAWLAPTDLSAPGRDAVEPQVAVDGGGDTVAVWGRNDGSDFDHPGLLAPGRRRLDAACRPLGGGSQRDRTPGRDRPGRECDRRLGADQRRPRGDPGSLEAGRRRLDAGDGPLGLRKNRGRTPGRRSTRRVARSRSGRGQTASTPSSRAPFSDLSVEGPGPNRVDLSAKGENAREPQLGADGAGNVVAVWTRLEGTDTIAQAAFRSSGGAWTAGQRSLRSRRRCEGTADRRRPRRRRRRGLVTHGRERGDRAGS